MRVSVWKPIGREQHVCGLDVVELCEISTPASFQVSRRDGLEHLPLNSMQLRWSSDVVGRYNLLRLLRYQRPGVGLKNLFHETHTYASSGAPGPATKNCRQASTWTVHIKPNRCKVNMLKLLFGLCSTLRSK